MTLTTHVKAAVAALALAALALAAVAYQFVAQALHQGLADGASIRVVADNACTMSADGTHFTGCSSVL